MNSLRKINLRPIIGHFLIIVFLALISYGLAGNIAVRSATGIILACISLAATVVFLLLLPRLYKQDDEENWQG